MSIHESKLKLNHLVQKKKEELNQILAWDCDNNQIPWNTNPIVALPSSLLIENREF